MKTEKTVLPAEILEMTKGVSTEKSNEVQNVLNKVFNGVSKMREQLDSIEVEDEADKVNMKLANTIRLGVRQTRLDSERTFDSKRSEVQQAMLSFKTEDSLWLKAKQTMQILTKEIEANAKWKEDTAKRFDIEQKEIKTQQRENLVNKFNPEILRDEFENMGDETFNTFLSGIEKAHNDKIKAEKAEAKRIEDERIAKEKAIEEQRLENERLKKEAEAKEKELAKERKEAKAKADAIEAKAKIEREQQEIKDAKIKAENEAKAKAEQQSKAKIEAELKAVKDAELKAKIEAEAKAEAERLEAIKNAKAPVKDKMKRWVDSFELPQTEVENETTKEIISKFESFKKWSVNQVENL